MQKIELIILIAVFISLAWLCYWSITFPARELNILNQNLSKVDVENIVNEHSLTKQDIRDTLNQTLFIEPIQ